MQEAREHNRAKEQASVEGEPPPVELAPIPVEAERKIPLRTQLAEARAMITTLEKEIKALELRNEDLENLNAALLAMRMGGSYD